MIDTPWGEIQIADSHVHFFSPAFFNAVAEQKKTRGIGPAEIGTMLGWDTPASPEELADRWAGEMDIHGVGTAVLIASTPGDVESVGIAVERHPGRFHSLLMVNPMLPGADMRCSTALEEGQIHGIFLLPAMYQFSMRDPHVHSLLAIVAGFPGAVCYVHCGMLSLGFRKKLGLHSPFDMRYSNPIDLHLPALAFPNLPFVIPHFGAGYLREALMLADLCPNVYFDTSSTNKWMRCEPQDIDLPRVFRKALEVVGPERLLFGTDSSFFPRGWVRGVFDAQVKALMEVGVDADTARAIFGGNLRALFDRSRRTMK